MSMFLGKHRNLLRYLAFGGMRIVFSPYFLVTTLVGTVAAWAALRSMSLYRRHLSFQSWETTREQERELQKHMADTWLYRASSFATQDNFDEVLRQQEHAAQREHDEQARQRRVDAQRKQYAVDENDYYALLNLPEGPNASTEQVQRAFRRELLRWHPDQASSAIEATIANERTRAIVSAYSVLRNPAKRRMYDATYTPRR